MVMPVWGIKDINSRLKGWYSLYWINWTSGLGKYCLSNPQLRFYFLTGIPRVVSFDKEGHTSSRRPKKRKSFHFYLRRPLLSPWWSNPHRWCLVLSVTKYGMVWLSQNNSRRLFPRLLISVTTTGIIFWYHNRFIWQTMRLRIVTRNVQTSTTKNTSIYASLSKESICWYQIHTPIQTCSKMSCPNPIVWLRRFWKVIFWMWHGWRSFVDR